MRQGCILTYQRRFRHKVHEKKNGQANEISQHLNVEVEANKGEDSKISTYNEPEKSFNEEKKGGENTMKHEPLEMETGNHVVDLETVGLEEGSPSQEKANVVLVDEANEDTDALGYLICMGGSVIREGSESSVAMANGEYLESSVRPGMKREFAAMMRAQAESGMRVTPGRGRITRSRDSPSVTRSGRSIKSGDLGLSGGGSPRSKKKKKVKAEVNAVDEEPRSDVLDGNSDDDVVQTEEANGSRAAVQREEANGGTVDGVDSSNVDGVDSSNVDGATPPKTYVRRFTRSALKPAVEAVAEQSGTEWEVGDPKKISKDKLSKAAMLEKTLSKLKELLSTGLLEGLPVRYLSSRASKDAEEGLRGVIQGCAILCYCDGCQGIRAVSPIQFELHAGSANKRPPEYIYLPNGNTLHDVMNACKLASPDSLEEAIQVAIGGAVTMPKARFCRECKGQATSLDATMLCDSCVSLSKSPKEISESSDIDARMLLPGSSEKSAIVKSTSQPSKSKSQGKLTRKDLGLHKLVFQSPYLEDGTPLSYFVRGEQLNTGYKSGSGIFCNCCKQVVSPSVFEAHAGCASRRKPYLQIFTPKGESLHEISLAIKRCLKHESTEQNDDVCSICKGTGELLCCDLCPRAFHKECVNLASIPEGEWCCRLCSLSVNANMEDNANALAAGRRPGLDVVEEVRKRCTRIVGALEPEVGGCVLCRGHDFSKEEFGPGTVILCDQCEREYHVGCLKEHGMDDLKELPNEKWFCCSGCSSIHSSLEKLVNDGEKKLPDQLLSIIKKKYEDGGSASEDNSDPNISWRLFHGKVASDEDKKWLSDAVTVLHDSFDPISNSKKNSEDLIPLMIHGKSNIDHDFGGMYTAVLIVNSRVVSAGIFRIFGEEAAEIPLVATLSTCQGKGYFQASFSYIENFLKSLNVRDLVLPSAHESESIWLNKFGFVKISAEQLKLYRRDYQMMIFQGTSVLHKTYQMLEQQESA